METVSKIRKWGNSYGLLIPKEVIEEENLSLDEEVIVRLEKKRDISKIFGILKTKKSTDDIMKEIREGYDD